MRHALARALIAPLALAALAAVAVPARAADAALVEAARKEGEVTWYTALIVDQFARPLAAAFESKYGVKVNLVRSTATEVVVRTLNEARAGNIQVDMVDGNGFGSALRAANALQRWLPDSARALSPDLRDRDGYWVATNMYVMTPGVNTDLVPANTRPKTYEDLLDPRWKGKMAWGSIPSVAAAPGFIAVVLASMGEDRGMDYLRRLAAQDIADVGVAAGRPLVDKLIAGEYSIALQIFHHHAAISAKQGAPVDWAPMQPALANYHIAAATNGPHPAAGRLTLDFMMSREGQSLMQQADYLPIDPTLKLADERLRPNEQTLKVRWFSPEEIERGMPKWMGIYKELFR